MATVPPLVATFAAYWRRVGAIAAALIGIRFAYFEGMAAGGALVLCTVVGSVAVIATSGARRFVLTLLYTSTLNIGFFVSLPVYVLWKYGEIMGQDGLVMDIVWCASSILLPSAFARLITQINGDL